eukprot:scaffold1921_cov384-Pinguiococcus_pyrenoidosus.AAC.3
MATTLCLPARHSRKPLPAKTRLPCMKRASIHVQGSLRHREVQLWPRPHPVSDFTWPPRALNMTK